MRRRRGSASIAANPVLIGAATTLVVIVAVFLAYNANNGLPFVPTYQLRAHVPSAAQLVRGNEVRLGGARVGVVDTIDAQRNPNGTAEAVLGLKLEQNVQPLPVDSSFIVRPRSALGLKYLEITQGRDQRGFANGADVPLANARPRPVEIDDLFNMFDQPTRAASQQNLYTFGNALAGRGNDVNRLVAALPSLTTNLEPVMRGLADRRTGLDRFVRALGRTSALLAPVAETQAAAIRNLDTTFGALAEVKGSLQEATSTAPGALDAGIRGFPIQRPFLDNTRQLFAELRPGVDALPAASRDLATAFSEGRPVLGRSVALNERLTPTFRSLRALVQDPFTQLTVGRLGRTAALLDRPLRYLRPAQELCNYGSLFFFNAASVLSEGDGIGTWQRFIPVNPPGEVGRAGTSGAPNNEFGPSSGPARGRGETKEIGEENHLHTNPYPNVGGPGQPRECEAGNESFREGTTQIGNGAGNQGTGTRATTIEQARRPVLRGPASDPTGFPPGFEKEEAE